MAFRREEPAPTVFDRDKELRLNGTPTPAGTGSPDAGGGPEATGPGARY